MVIATGRYLQFAIDLVQDLDRVLPPTASPTVNLFTDARASELRTLQALVATPINVVRVPELRWPEASLYRYELFTEAADQVRGRNLVYLDADIRVAADFSHLVQPETWPNAMAAVRHPGYYRRRRVRPRGTWETRRASRAYVPPWRRRTYVCGGVWMGSRNSFLAVSSLLAERVRHDAEDGVTARWHDESHWNWWVAHNSVRLFDPSMCFVGDYPWLAHLRPIIVAVDKGHFQREATQTNGAAAVRGVPRGARNVDDQ